MGTFKVAFMCAALCAEVTGWITAGTGGWAEPASGQCGGVLGQQPQALSLHRAGRMQTGRLLALSWKVVSQRCLLLLWHVFFCGVFQFYWQADSGEWLISTALRACPENYVSAVTACTMKAANKCYRVEIRWILCWFFSEYKEVAALPSFGPTDIG